MVGLPLFFGAPTSLLEAMVQVPGEALRLSASAFRTTLAEMPALSVLLLRYTDSFHAQVTQTAVCNGRHHIEQRLARWLLMTHDRAEGRVFAITQEFMSTMIGVQRPGVTLAMAALQRAGLVEHARGKLTVLNRLGLEAVACECYAVVQRRFDWLLKSGHG